MGLAAAALGIQSLMATPSGYSAFGKMDKNCRGGLVFSKLATQGSR